MLRDKRDKDINTLFKDVFACVKSEPDAMRLVTFYRSGMNTRLINKTGISALNPEFALIDSVRTRKDLVGAMGGLFTKGIKTAFGVYAAQDETDSSSVIANFLQAGISLPDRDYYFSKDTRTKSIRTAFVRYAEKLFRLSGCGAKQAKSQASLILRIETCFAQKSFSRLELRDTHKNYNPCQLSDLQRLCPSFDFGLFCTQLGIGTFLDKINVGQKPFFENFSKMFKSITVEDWKVFMRFRVLNAMSPYIGKDFEQAHFDFYSTALSGVKKMKPRWKKITGITSSALGEIVGRLYVEKHFPPESKKRMLKLVENLKYSLQDRIAGLDWMGAKTKKHALKKLGRMGVKIGYPDKWTDYGTLELCRVFARNIIEIMRFDVRKNLDRLGKPVDRIEWEMTPQTINAYYHPSMNEIVFPAAILQPPFFNPNADDAVNYGAIGTIIGHEMTHAFDDQGREFDADGNLRGWWSAKDVENFKKRSQVLVCQYGKYSPIAGYLIDGKLTLGENIADAGGLKISLKAFESVLNAGKARVLENSSLSPIQRFFVSFAQCFMGVFRPEYQIRLLREDVHSPVEFRVNGAVANIDEFYAAFDVTAQNAMFIAPQHRAKVW